MEEEREEKIENGDTDMEMIPDEEAGGGTAAKLAKLREELVQCRDERRGYLDGWQRAKADLINYKREEAKRFEELAKFAAEGIVAEVVSALDSFDLALHHEMPKDVERGIVLIRSQLEDTLRRRGLEVIQSLGQPFDPAAHESLGEVGSEGEEGLVIEELQKGYRLNGRVLRPARVKISKSK